MRKYILFIFIFISLLHSFAQDSALMNELMQRIAGQQASGHPFFIDGIIPSYISNHSQFSKSKKDNNIFFTALVDYTLLNLYKEHFADSTAYNLIHSKALLAYPYFKNKKGRTSYNFWRTDTAYTFPYT